MAKLEISESSYLKISNGIEENGIGEIYDEKEYSKIPISQINLNTEPISIISDFSYNFFDSNIKSYIKVFFGFIVFVLFLIVISTLSGKFHYDKPEIDGNRNNNQNNTNDSYENFNNDNNNKNDTLNNNVKNESNLNLRILDNNAKMQLYLDKYNLTMNNHFQ